MDNPENKSDVNPPKKYIAMPYIKTASERVGRILKKFDIVLSNKSSNTIGSILSNAKQKTNFNEKTDCVYKISCQNCPAVYIGETKKQAKERIHEH